MQNEERNQHHQRHVYTYLYPDDKIVKFLQGNGIDIARRTVAKYRESMGISSSVQRRKEKQINI